MGGIRYTREELERLRQSPLVVKPTSLPPAEEWMGPALDNGRNQAKLSHPDRSRNIDSNSLLDQTNRRPTLDRHMSRGSANPEDIILGPPKTSFASATSLRNATRGVEMSDRNMPPKDVDSRDRFNIRKGGEVENSRDSRNNSLRPKRVEGEQDSDGWSTVKPRKSFGTEGAERFNGRMGGDRHREDRRFREREDREGKDRTRGFDTFSREKEADNDQDGVGRRNGTGRGRNEPSWFKEGHDSQAPTVGDRKANGDRFVDRTRGWREKDAEEKTGDRRGDRGDDRGGDRRWDRDRRQERDPEWMDEPADEKRRAHTQEDFQKWKESMNAGSSKTPAADEGQSKESGGQSSFFGLEKAKVETPLVMDSGPDKFFGMWAQPKQETSSETTLNSKKEGVAKPNTAGKSSRFTSFFAPQEDPQRRQTEPPPPMPSIPLQASNGQSSKEKEDFQRLLQKLHSQNFGGPGLTPPAAAYSQPKPPSLEKLSSTSLPASEPVPQYRPERQDPSRSSNRDPQQATLQDLLSQRQNASSQPSARPEQMVHELINQRQNALSQTSTRPDPNGNAAFFMGLLQNAQAAPEPLRSEQLMMRGPPPQPQLDRQMQQMGEREQELHREQRERSASQRQRRPDVPPGFFDESMYQRGPQPPHEGNPNVRPQGPPQPTQILQRPPPGLDQLPPGWGQSNAQLPPSMSQQRHIAPPPGLAGGPSRGMPMPQNMFPPGFPMGGFGPPPDGMGGAPRNMPPPPPGFMMPPPGFMGGPPMNAFGPEGMAYGGGPFDGRGAPQGNFRRQ